MCVENISNSSQWLSVRPRLPRNGYFASASCRQHITCSQISHTLRPWCSLRSVLNMNHSNWHRLATAEAARAALEHVQRLVPMADALDWCFSRFIYRLVSDVGFVVSFWTAYHVVPISLSSPNEWDLRHIICWRKPSTRARWKDQRLVEQYTPMICALRRYIYPDHGTY